MNKQLFIALISSTIIPLAHSMNPDQQLFDAVKNRDEAAIERALGAHANVNAKDADNITPLHYATIKSDARENPQQSIVARLLEAGANVNARNYRGRTPFQNAASDADLQIIEMMLTKTPDINEQDGVGRTALHYAAVNKDPQVTNLLIQNGASIFIDNLKRTPLHYAIEYHNVEVVKVLLDRSGPQRSLLLGVQDYTGKTVLDYARKSKNNELLRLFLQTEGLKVKIKNETVKNFLVSAETQKTVVPLKSGQERSITIPLSKMQVTLTDQCIRNYTNILITELGKVGQQVWAIVSFNRELQVPPTGLPSPKRVAVELFVDSPIEVWSDATSLRAHEYDAYDITVTLKGQMGQDSTLEVAASQR